MVQIFNEVRRWGSKILIYCYNNNIELIEISYKDINNINEILKQKL